MHNKLSSSVSKKWEATTEEEEVEVAETIVVVATIIEMIAMLGDKS